MQEQRLTYRLTHYWQKIRKDKAYPDMRHFNQAAVEDLWPNCFRVTVDNKERHLYRYEYMGEAIRSLHGRDLIGQPVEMHVMTFPGKVIHKKFDQAASGEAVEDQGHFLNNEGQLIKYRACLLPFGNEERGVTHLLIGLSWRAF